MPIFLSQGHLNLLSQCPRRYQYTYLEGLLQPLALSQQRAMDWGSRFHTLMQQQALGLPLGDLLKRYPEFALALDRLEQVAPHLFRDPQGGESWFNEQSCSYFWPQATQDGSERVVLQGVFDRLVLQGDRAEVLDWKTYGQPQDLGHLRHHWQTRLYLYLLVEALGYVPEQVSMTYWFVRPPKASGEKRDVLPQSCTFAYDTIAHTQTQGELQRLVADLQRWYRDQSQGLEFPRIPQDDRCGTCPFNQPCGRATLEPTGVDGGLDLAQFKAFLGDWGDME